jgi:hypothetical protein
VLAYAAALCVELSFYKFEPMPLDRVARRLSARPTNRRASRRRSKTLDAVIFSRFERPRLEPATAPKCVRRRC